MRGLRKNNWPGISVVAVGLILAMGMVFGADKDDAQTAEHTAKESAKAKKDKGGLNLWKKEKPVAEDELLFQLAESHYQGGEYKEAQRNYMELIENYPFSPRVNTAQFMIAKCYLNLNNPEQALGEFKLYTMNNKMDSELVEAHEWIQKLERQRYDEEQKRTRHTMTEVIEENFRLRETQRWLQPTINEEEVYLELNLAEDQLMIKMGTQVLYSFPMVSGKGRTWIKGTGRYRDFSTPKGIRHITYKERNPVWYRPNWSWLERGLEIPDDLEKEDRAVPGVLGKYRINLGEGYAIHGTRSGRIKPGKYSHGCIRLSARDLKKVWDMTEEGTKVFIY
jgi:tetratricopeptide (TPR) repeat protein